MSEKKSEPEAVASTSQIADVPKKPLIPLVSLPKVVLTRLDIKNLPIPVYTSPTKKSVKRLKENENKPKAPKAIPNQAVPNSKHDPRTRGKPKQNYKMLAEFGTSFTESTEGKLKTKQVSEKVSIKKDPKLTSKIEDDSPIKSMLKKTMLQKRSKIAIPPVKKRKLMPKKSMPTKPQGKSPSMTPSIKRETLSQSKNSSFGMENTDSEDDSLFDELIEEIVNSPKVKIAPEKTTNITLKPNAGNKPPTIVKGGIVKKSSLPPDLKSVASPTSLNSSKHTVISLNVKSKSSEIENTIKSPATAESPKANLPVRASPFPITLSSSKAGSKDNRKIGQKIVEKPASTLNENPSMDFHALTKPSKQVGNVQKTKPKNSDDSVPRQRGRPRIGPKQVIKPAPTADDESDEYTEIETLENVESEGELASNMEHSLTKNEEIQVLQHKTAKSPIKSVAERSAKDKSKKDEDPHLDLLRILTDDTENAAEAESSGLIEGEPEIPHQIHNDYTEQNSGTSDLLLNSDTSKKTNSIEAGSSRVPKSYNPGLKSDETLKLLKGEVTSNLSDELSVLSAEPAVEEKAPVRTIYDLMNEVSLQYPSWNLHIIPETNAFCIAQVTKGRLGLPTLKKCIELDPDTYSAKVYIHQYHIKRFDGVYDSEDAIHALIEEINSIKA